MRFLYSLYRLVLDYALPPRCPGCGAVTPDDYQFCATCWLSLDFMGGAGCLRCGVPMPYEEMVCAPCMADPPRHDGVFAVTRYDGVARRVVLNLKYGRRIGNAITIAKLMSQRFPMEEDVLLIPVPLHRWRIWQRGYNQAALIVRHLHKLSDAPILLDGLVRIRATRSLAGLSKKARAKEVRAAIKVNPQHRAALKGKKIILVDDVYTSGATANACARALKAAGVKKVELMVWARVLREGYGIEAQDN